MVDMRDAIKQLFIFVLVILLMVGFFDHLFSSGIDNLHFSQEANCPIHSGVAQPEPEPAFLQVSADRIGEKQDDTHAFDLIAKISHPPTI